MTSPHPPLQTEPDEFTQALASFENALETPFVPGEMELWIAAVRESFADLIPLLAQRRQTLHEDEFREIAEADPESLRRVEQMREEDGAIEEAMASIDGQIAAFETQIPKLEPDEARVLEDLTEFADMALATVIRIRKQEVALRTWLAEAFQRVRGDMD